MYKIKPILKWALIIAIIVFVWSSIAMRIEMNHNNKQSEAHNKRILNTIAVYGNNVANHLESFLLKVEQSTQSEAQHMEAADHWRIVMGQSKDIYGQTHLINMEVLSEDDYMSYGLLKHILYRVSSEISFTSYSFIEQQSLSLTDQQTEKLESVVSIYQALSVFFDKNNTEQKNVADIVKQIEPYIIVIDEHYPLLLEGRN